MRSSPPPSSHSKRAAVFQASALELFPLSQPRQPIHRAADPSAPPSQEQQVSANRLHYSRAGCIVAAVLITAGAGLDHFAYPDRLEEFMRLRLIATIALLSVWSLLYTKLGARHVRSISLFWLMIPQVMIAWMVHDTNGADSSYFAGLILAMFAVGTVLPVTASEGAFFGVVTLLLYTLACGTHANGISEGASASFFTHCLFILLSAITATVCAWLNERSRARLQAMKDAVSGKNAELQEINHTLSQIKGQLVEREKMAAIGSLSAGLLQELNNPVNYSMMAINQGLGMSAVRGDKMLTESLQDAREGMERVRTIVADLRTFTHAVPSGDSPKPFALEKAIRSAIRLASYELKGVTVSVEMQSDTLVMGDEPALIGVLINLLSNAAHAVKSTKNPHFNVQLRGELQGDRVRISVRDNGPGIDKGLIGRVFEPFFTTRGIGSGLGLGLGLSMSQAIVQHHKSELTVRSELGAWTEFSFDLATL
jgi:two-component system sensor histidine kinase PhcS